MPGNRKGGKKAAKTNIERHGEDFYRRIGAKGGRNGHTGGFAANPALAKLAGKKGGKSSSRKGVKNGEGKYKRNAKPQKKSLMKRIFGGK